MTVIMGLLEMEQQLINPELENVQDNVQRMIVYEMDGERFCTNRVSLIPEQATVLRSEPIIVGG